MPTSRELNLGSQETGATVAVIRNLQSLKCGQHTTIFYIGLEILVT